MNDRAARTLNLNFLSHSETKLFEISIFGAETNNVSISKKIFRTSRYLLRLRCYLSSYSVFANVKQ